MPELYLSETLRVRDKGDGDWAFDYYDGATWNEVLRYNKSTGNLEVTGKIMQDLDFDGTYQVKGLAAPASGEALRKGNKDITLSEITDAILTGLKVATVADVNTTGGIPVVHRIDIADGAGDTDITLDHKTRVMDAWAVKTDADGGAGDTVQVKNGANVITDAMDIGVTDTTVVRAGTIDDAQHEIASGGTLRVTAANATNNACIVYVLGVRVA